MFILKLLAATPRKTNLYCQKVHGTTPANPLTVIHQDSEFPFIAKLIPGPSFWELSWLQ